MTDDEASVLEGQILYYRARANEYDDWFLRLGRYDRGEDATQRWFAQIEEVRDVLSSLPLDDKNVLELAPGTGIWTEALCDRVAHLTAVDASSEMIALNRERLGARAGKVTFVEADLFEWLPTEEFDAVVFCFWLSHIPTRRIDEFLSRVATMLTLGGAVFFLDARREPTSTASDHVLPFDDQEIMTRRLDDGREFSIYKNFWDGPVLEEKCRHAGLEVSVHETKDYFQFGVGTRV
ncbi:MAG: class I SAM-dependent methyltransferase [Acidobacteria bacterium]|nr:class I SAM-dependent methyltransferase [Acidobacteriota bacterium]